MSLSNPIAVPSHTDTPANIPVDRRAAASVSIALPSSLSTTPAALPTRIARYRLTPDQVPVDFFADPDGSWEFASLVEMAGFNPEHPGASVGALAAPFDGYPEGSAVITEVGVECRYIALAELPKSSRSGSTRGAESRRHHSASAGRRQPHRAA